MQDQGPFADMQELILDFFPYGEAIGTGFQPILPPVGPVSNGSFDISFDQNSFDVFRTQGP